MTLRQSETLLRALVALALGLGFVGFATHTHAAHGTVSPAAANVEVAATPVVGGAAHAGI
jgi:hypothetical protein